MGFGENENINKKKSSLKKEEENGEANGGTYYYRFDLMKSEDLCGVLDHSLKNKKKKKRGLSGYTARVKGV